MLLRTVVAGYLGATLMVAGTGVSAYKLLQARHAINASAPAAHQASLQAEPWRAETAGDARDKPGHDEVALPELRAPISPREERDASNARPRLPRLRAPLGVSSREPSRRRARTLTAAEQRPHPHPIVRYPVYYRVYYPYAYYSYYPPYSRY